MTRADGPRVPNLMRAFRFPFSHRRMRADVDAELAFHLESRVDEIMSREGLTRPEAEVEAGRRFGDVSDYRRQLRTIDSRTHLREQFAEGVRTMRREFRQSLRSLRRSPSFSLIAIFTLALGLGACTAIFTILDRVVLRSLSYPDAGRLVAIGTKWPGIKQGEEYGISSYMYFRFRALGRDLENLGVYQTEVFALPASNGAEAEKVTAVDASASLFPVLGIKAAIGRTFNTDDERPEDPSIIVLSHLIWLRRYGGDPAIVGKSVDIGGRIMQVVGVLPTGATLPNRDGDIWTPLHLDSGALPQNNHVLHAIGLLKPDASVDRAAATLSVIASRITTDNPHVYGEKFLRSTGFGLFVRSLHDEVIGPDIARVLWVIFAAVALVLVIAATNVAALFLVRIDARRREIAMRAALGAGRGQVALHCLSESLLLATAAAIGALALAEILLHVILAFAPTTLPRLDEIALDARGIAFCVLAAMVTGISFGVLPLRRATLDIAILRDGGRGVPGSRRQAAVRRTLVTLQVALSVVLIVSAGLMAKSFSKLRSVRPGFDPAGVLTMSIALRPDRYRTDAQIVGFWRQMSSGVAALPGVSEAGGISSLPLTSDAGCTALFVEESESSAGNRTPCVPVVFVSPGYFETMEIPIQGVAPGWAENESGTGNMVVSKSLAAQLWPGAGAIGKTIVFQQQRRLVFRVSGIAGDVRADGVQKPPIAAAYFPLAAPTSAGVASRSDFDVNFLHFVVRSNSNDMRKLGTAIRRVAAEIDPQVPVAEFGSMESIVAKSMAQTTFAALVIAIAAMIATLLSAVGIYGVISYTVVQRRSEIGIRMALGARFLPIARVVIGQAIVLAIAGAAIGIFVATLATRALRSLLYEVSPSDPSIAIGAISALLGIAALASCVPARRAAAIDPAEALRAE